MNPKQKNDSDCNFYNFSLLVPLPQQLPGSLFLYRYFPWYKPLLSTQKYFFCGAKSFFPICSQGIGKFQISWRPSVLGGTNIFFGRGGSAIFFHKTINDQISKLSVSYMYTNSSRFQLRIFRLRIFCLFKRPFNIVWY